MLPKENNYLYDQDPQTGPTLILRPCYSKKRDWNTLVRTGTGKRDPIGTTAEAMTKRSRQSLRLHILDNVEARTIDPQKLLGKLSSFFIY